MEGGKRAAAVAAMCMLLLLMLAKPSQQQLSDIVCECYRQCYAGCKDITWPRVCKVECAGGCGGANGGDKLGTCMIACSMDPVCGLSTAPVDPAEVLACNNECEKRWGGHGHAN
ncbi:hypothetical protein CFC21_090213 [Triticum aestivum]|uniref:Acidic protein n=2 Tax=Triticum aestivum TaxID=4565 RepID=A0A9R1MRI6_WHEAT|nr:hypothetical protein CFC21_090213 [Triticum aestivum]